MTANNSGKIITSGEKLGATVGALALPVIYVSVFSNPSASGIFLSIALGIFIGWALDIQLPERIAKNKDVRRGVGVAAGKLKKQRLPAVRQEVLLGEIVENGQPFIMNLWEMQHVLIRAITQNGKTTLIHHLLKELLQGFEREDVCMFIFDGKHIDYTAFECYRFLLAPVAQNDAEFVKAARYLREYIGYRERLFNDAQRHFGMVINNISTYNKMAKTTKGKAFGMKKMEVCLVLLDEAQHIVSNSHVEEVITQVATMGAGLGVYYVLTAQYNKASSINTTIQRQANYVFTGFISTDRNVYAVGGTRLGANVKLDYILEDKKGRFLVTHRGDYQTIQAPAVAYKDLKKEMNKRSLDVPPIYPEWFENKTADSGKEKAAVVEFSEMNEDEKLGYIYENLGSDPTVDEIGELTGLKERSCWKWRKKVADEFA